MTTYETTDERQAALAPGETAYRAWADRHGIDADEADLAQLAELDALQVKAQKEAVSALRVRSA